MPGERAQVVFITGASSGIGAALAKVYADRGATVCLLARRQDALDAVQKSLGPPTGPAHLALSVDVTDAKALAAAAQTAIDHAGLPDVVIANAGISVGAQIGPQADLAVIQRIITTNVYATAATFAPFIAPMSERRSGRLVTIASVAAVRGLPGGGAYSASKAAAVVLTESLRVELIRTGIKVVTIAPGFIATPMTSRNPYKMPFLLPVDVFARRAVRAIDQGTSYRVIPWQMGVIAKLLRLAPNWLFDRAFANAKRKPRHNDEPRPVSHQSSGRTQMDYHFLARFHVRGGQEGVAEAALAEVGRATRAEKRCLSWYGFRLKKDPSCFIITSSWADRTAFDAHAQEAHTKQFTEIMRSIADREPTYEGGTAVL